MLKIEVPFSEGTYSIAISFCITYTGNLFPEATLRPGDGLYISHSKKGIGYRLAKTWNSWGKRAKSAKNLATKNL
jgi:hypothetical protein